MIKEQGNKGTFEIRMHHAIEQGVLFSDKRTKAEIDTSITEFTEQLLKCTQETMFTPNLDLLDLLGEESGEVFQEVVLEDSRKYALDILGQDPMKYIPTYNEAIRAYIHDYVKLPKTAPIRLTQKKDRMCSSCAIGNHCNEESQIKFDQECFRVFIGVAYWIGKDDEKDFRVLGDELGITAVETTKKTLTDVIKAQKTYPITHQEDLELYI